MDKMVTKFKMVKEIYVAWLVDKKKKGKFKRVPKRIYKEK